MLEQLYTHVETTGHRETFTIAPGSLFPELSSESLQEENVRLKLIITELLIKNQMLRCGFKGNCPDHS
jgi:hypothetical protein